MKKAYIVTNKEQELEALKKFEQDGLFWSNGEKPTEWITSNEIKEGPSFNFPYVLVEQEGSITWILLNELMNEIIVYDGRNEEKMDKKYLVTQEFMDELIKWRDKINLDASSGMKHTYISPLQLDTIPRVFFGWQLDGGTPIERNNRLIAIIQWLSGEDVFEVEKTYKYYVARDSYPIVYLSMKKMYHSEFPTYDSNFSNKKIFDTREEAEKWLVPGYEVEKIDVNEL